MCIIVVKNSRIKSTKPLLIKMNIELKNMEILKNKKNV